MIDLRSLMGYSKGSPWENAPYNLIKTSDGRITMANTKKKLKAFDAKTGKFLSNLEPGKEYQFDTDHILEVPSFQKGGPKYIPPANSERSLSPTVNDLRKGQDIIDWNNYINSPEYQNKLKAQSQQTQIGPTKKLTDNEKVKAKEQKIKLNSQYIKDKNHLSLDDEGNIINNSKYLNMDGTSKPHTPAAQRDKGFEGLLYAGEIAMLPSVTTMGKLVKPLGEYLTEKTILSKAYKINPFAFKPNPKAYYRGIGEAGYKDAIESGVLRAKQNVEPIMVGPFDMSKQFSRTYYTPRFNTADQYGKGFLAEVPKDATTFRPRYTKGKDWSQIANENIPIDKARFLKKDWLQGYKEIPKPTSTQSITKGPIKWEDAVNKVDNPNFNAQTYLNNAGGQGYVPPTTDPKLMARLSPNPKNLDDLNYAKDWANKYGYELPSNLDRVAQSDVLTDRTIRGVVNRHNTFVRGVSTNWKELEKYSPSALEHLKKIGIDYTKNPKQAAEYMATHIPPQTGYGRAGMKSDMFNSNLDGLYTSNSMATAEGYTYGDGYMVKVKKPTDFSSTNRQDWINKNQVNYLKSERLTQDEINKLDEFKMNNYKSMNSFHQKRYEEAIPDIKKAEDAKDWLKKQQIEIGWAKKAEEDFNKYAAEQVGLDKKLGYNINYKPGDIIKTSAKKTISPKQIGLGDKNITIAKIHSEILPKLELSAAKKLNLQSDLGDLAGELRQSGLKSDEIAEKLKGYILDKYSNPYAHYIHLGNPGQKMFEPVSSTEMNLFNYKNKSRAHTGAYSKGLSAAATIPAAIGANELLNEKPKKAFKNGGEYSMNIKNLPKYQWGGNCPEGFTWSVADQQCMPLDQAQASNFRGNSNKFIMNTGAKNTQPFIDMSKYMLTPQQEADNAKAEFDKQYPENGVANQNSDVSKPTMQIKRSFGTPNIPNIIGLNLLSFGLSAFANKAEEGRQKAFMQRQMNDPSFNGSFSNAQNDYGVDPYEQTGQLRKPVFQQGGRTPIQVTNPNDPRLRAYSDSLVAFNNERNFYKEFIPAVKSAKTQENIVQIRNKLMDKYPQNKIGPIISYELEKAPILFERPDLKYKVRKTGIYKKPVQPVILQTEPQFKRPISIPRESPNIGNVGQPQVGEPNMQQAQYDNQKPTNYSFTNATGNYLEGQQTYFPDEQSLRKFAESQRGVSIQSNSKGATATGYLNKFARGGKFDPVAYVYGDDDEEISTIKTKADKEAKKKRITEDEADNTDALLASYGLSAEDIVGMDGPGIGNRRRTRNSDMSNGAGMPSFVPSGKTNSGIAEMFYDPINLNYNNKRGFKGSPLGNHANHGHFATTDPTLMKNAKDLARFLDLNIREDGEYDPNVDPVHATNSYHYQKIGKSRAAMDINGDPQKIKTFFDQVQSFKEGGTYSVDFETMRKLQAKGIKFKIVE